MSSTSKLQRPIVEATDRNGSVSPGWTAMDQPIPIGNSVNPALETVTEITEGNQVPMSTAMYVTSQESEPTDFMGQIADEFQQAALSRKSSAHINQSIGNQAAGTENGLQQGHAMQPEETEVWSADEEPTEHTNEVNYLRIEPTYSTIGEESQTTTRQNTQSSNTVTLSSDGGSMVNIETNGNAETTSRAPEQSNISEASVINDPVHRPTQVQANIGPRVPITNDQQQTTGHATISDVNIATAPGSVSHVNTNPPLGPQIRTGGQNTRVRPNPASQSADGVNARRHPVGVTATGNNRRWNYSINGGSLSARGDNAAGTETNGVQHKALLEIMGIGLGNFTNDMATIVIDKLRPEYDVIAKRVGQSVKEETTVELAELREKVDAAEKLLNHLESEKNKLHDELMREKDHMRKEIDKERTKRMKENEEKDEKIDKLEKELKKAQMLNREKDRMSRRAESKAKTEEHKRTQVEETCDTKLKEMHKEISKLKSEILVQKSKNRVQSANARDMVKSGSLARKLKSYHESSKGKWPAVHPKHVPYDEGDP